MSKRWLRERKRDFYYRKAKRMDYRSRASFKLMQIDERFHIIPKGRWPTGGGPGRMASSGPGKGRAQG